MMVRLYSALIMASILYSAESCFGDGVGKITGANTVSNQKRMSTLARTVSKTVPEETEVLDEIKSLDRSLQEEILRKLEGIHDFMETLPRSGEDLEGRDVAGGAEPDEEECVLAEISKDADETDLDSKFRKRIDGLPPSTRTTVIMRYREKQAQIEYNKCLKRKETATNQVETSEEEAEQEPMTDTEAEIFMGESLTNLNELDKKQLESLQSKINKYPSEIRNSLKSKLKEHLEKEESSPLQEDVSPESNEDTRAPKPVELVSEPSEPSIEIDTPSAPACDESTIPDKFKKRLTGLSDAVKATVVKRYCEKQRKSESQEKRMPIPTTVESAPAPRDEVRAEPPKDEFDESQLDPKFLKRLEGLSPAVRAAVIRRYLEKKAKAASKESAVRDSVPSGPKVNTPIKKENEAPDNTDDLDPAFLKKIQRFSPSVRQALIKRYRSKKAREETRKPTAPENKSGAEPLVTANKVEKKDKEFDINDIDPKLRKRLEGLPAAQREIVLQRIKEKALRQRQGALNKDDPISTESIDEMIKEFDAVLDAENLDYLLDIDLQDLIPELSALEEQCSDPFVAIQGYSVLDYLNTLIEDDKIATKTDTVELCTRLCLQRNGVCTAYEYDSETHDCRILHNKPDLADLSPSHTTYHYQLKPICVGKDRFLIPDALSLTIGSTAGYKESYRTPEYKNNTARESVIMQKTENYQPPFTFGRDYSPYSEEECVQYCFNDITPQARDRRCYGLEYQSDIRRCTLLAKLRTTPPVNPEPQLKPGFVSYRKLSVSENAEGLCTAGHVTGVPQHVLIGFDQKIVSVSSYDECVDRCFHLNRDNYTCKSGAFYTREKEQNCVLSFEDHWSQPKTFLQVEADDLRVEYFAIDTCMRA